MVDELMCFRSSPKKDTYQDSHIRTPISLSTIWVYCSCWDIQGYPQSMKLQKRFYGICTLSLYSWLPVAKNFFLSLQNHQIRHFKATIKTEDLIQTLNRYISRFSSRLYSLILCGRVSLFINEFGPSSTGGGSKQLLRF